MVAPLNAEEAGLVVHSLIRLATLLGRSLELNALGLTAETAPTIYDVKQDIDAHLLLLNMPRLPAND